MDELPFAPFLVAMESWRGVYDGVARMHGFADPIAHAPIPDVPGADAYREAFRHAAQAQAEVQAQAQAHADQAMAAAHDLADTFRGALFDVTAATLALPFAALSGLMAPVRKEAA